MAGTAPSPTSSKQLQAKALFATSSTVLLLSNAGNLALQLKLLLAILEVAEKDDAEPEVPVALLKATPLWNALFRLLKKSVKPIRADDDDPDREKAMRLQFMSNVIGLVGNTVHPASLHRPRECEGLVRIWANENLLGAFEEVIPMLVGMSGMTSG
jgi:hypothetical protein